MEENKDQMIDNMTTDRGMLSKKTATHENIGQNEPDKEKAIEALNLLIEINSDRIAGYEAISKETDEVDLKTLFVQFIYNSRKCMEELVNGVDELGGIPTLANHRDGQFFKDRMGISIALKGHNRQATINSCTKGEDLMLSVYRYQLANALNYVREEIKATLHKQYELLKADGDKVKGMSDIEA